MNTLLPPSHYAKLIVDMYGSDYGSTGVAEGCVHITRIHKNVPAHYMAEVIQQALELNAKRKGA